MQKKVKHIILFGSFHGNNKGDEAIAVAEILFLKTIWPKAKFTIASAKPDYFIQTYESYNVDAVNIFDLMGIRRIIKTADLCIIGGGGLFFEPKPFHTFNLKKNQSLVWPALAKYATSNHVPVIFLCIGAEPVNFALAKYIIKKGMNKAAAIIVRDDKTKKQLVSLGVNLKITTLFDAAWLLQSHTTLQKKEPSSKLKIAVSPHFGLGIVESPEYAQKFRKTMGEKLNEFSNSIEKEIKWYFLPLHPKDQPECESIMKLIDTDTKIVSTTDKTPLQIIDILTQMDIQVGMRMHGTILSVLANTPFVSITYANKSEQTINHIVTGSKIDARDLSLPYSEIEQLHKAMQFVLHHTEEIKNMETLFLQSIRKNSVPALRQTLHTAIPDLFPDPSHDQADGPL